MNSEKNVQFGKWYGYEKETYEKRIHPRSTPCGDTVVEEREPKSETCTRALGTDRPNG